MVNFFQDETKKQKAPQNLRGFLLKNNSARKSIIIISALIILLGFAMAAMGYIISTGARTALEAKVI